MLISAMQHSPNPAAQFSLVFHYFDGNSPFLSFLKFHEEFVLRNDYDGSKKHLKDFQLRMDKVNYGYLSAFAWTSHLFYVCV